MREEIPAPLAGERIDRVVAILTGLPRAEVAAIIDDGGVRIAEQVVTKPSRRVREGDVVDVEVPERPGAQVPTADASVEFDIVHADDHVIVVDKPAHLVVHPGAGNRERTLVSGLLARFPDLASLDTGDSDRPGIVHRLDAGTSGLLVVARTVDAYHDLVGQLTERSVERRYRALVLGHVEPRAGMVDAPIGRSEGDPTRMTVSASGREARTGYEVDAIYTEPVPTSELRCRLETGRTHQIRVHFAAIGHAVVGDDRYGGGRPAFPLDRPFLHAEELAFDHPATGERVRFTSPLPDDLSTVRRSLA
ncbi:MAG TPA: RluA family pseudouridine synthase [Acidimicrobiales bacterium]|jgi:23S rRNA pseudouridine1911/1915/1917 synthase|nr:RluA family pseudouridine synthase [Acidimicrobiales bacterium]